MPDKITTYQRQVLPSGKAQKVPYRYVPSPPTMPIHAGAEKWRALSDVGKAMMDMQEGLEQHRQKVVAENRANQFAQDIAPKLIQWKEKTIGDKTTPEAFEEYRKQINSMADSVIESSEDLDNTTKFALRKILNSYTRSSLNKAATHYHSQIKLVRDQNIEAAFKRLKLDVELGEKTPEQATEMQKTAIANNMGNLNELKLYEVEFQEAWAKADKEQERTNVIADLIGRYVETPDYKTKYGESYSGAINEVLSSDFIKKYGSDQQKKILTSLVSVQEREEAQQKIASEQWQQTNIPKLRDGALTYEEIETSPLTADEKKQWSGWLEQRTLDIATGKNDPLSVTDPAVDNKIMQQIYSDAPPDENYIKAQIGNGLSINRAEHWIETLRKPDDGYKRALEYLKSQIMPSKGLLEGESTKESQAYWRAVIELDNRLNKAIEEDKPLTGNEILKEAMNIAPSFTLSLQERIDSITEAAAELETEEEGFLENMKTLLKEMVQNAE